MKTNEKNARGGGGGGGEWGVGETKGTIPSLDQARIIFAWPVF